MSAHGHFDIESVDRVLEIQKQLIVRPGELGSLVGWSKLASHSKPKLRKPRGSALTLVANAALQNAAPSTER